MKAVSPRALRAALDREVPSGDPSAELWHRIRTAAPAPARRRFRTLTAVLTAFLTLALAGVAAATTEPGQRWLDKVFEHKGIKYVEVTPELEQRYEQAGGEVTQSAEAKWPEIAAAKPASMKLPTYLPGVFQGERLMHNVNRGDGFFSIGWYEPGTAAVTPSSVTLVYHSRAFPPGSEEGHHGPIQEFKEIKVNGLEGTAFLDDQGWTLLWAMDNHQYGLYTNLSFEEALKVAESIK